MCDAQGELSMTAGTLNDVVTFRRTDDERRSYTAVISCRGCISPVSGDETYLANAGYEALSVMTVTCRYQDTLMEIDPTKHDMTDRAGHVYELLSPGEDKGGRHTDIIFRVRRIFDGQ